MEWVNIFMTPVPSGGTVLVVENIRTHRVKKKSKRKDEVRKRRFLSRFLQKYLSFPDSALKNIRNCH